MYNEKRKPHHDLRAFQAAFERPGAVRLTATANKNARELGLLFDGVNAVIQSILPGNFYKSMTSNQDHCQWQDVYHVPFVNMVLYIKFSDDRLCEFILLSFKEK